MPSLCKEIGDRLDRPRDFLFIQGIGRSGLMAAGVLIQLGITADMAWQRISKARGISVPDTDEQKQWVSAHPRGYRGDSIT